MTGYTIWGAGVGAVALFIGMGVAFMNRSEAGDDYLKASQEMVSNIPGYSAAPAYYDSLVEQAHDEVFKDSYHMEYGGRRRRNRSWMDEGKYVEDLFNAMRRIAEEDNAVAVVAALDKHMNGEPEEPQPVTKATPRPAPKPESEPDPTAGGWIR